MSFVDALIFGFSQAGTVDNLMFCVGGVLLGTLVGVLPGLGPMATVSILLPMTYSTGDPLASIILLAGIYYGAQYGGSTTAILLRLPGEASSLVTMLDGNKMALNGRAGAALSIAAMSSFFAGTIATLLIAVAGEPMANFAIKFGPAEYTALLIMGLVICVTITNGDALSSGIVLLIGILFGLVGTDVNSGVPRFEFGSYELLDGLSFGVLAMGVFGLSEILWNVLHEPKPASPNTITLKDLYPTRKEFNNSIGATFRGTTVGSIIGLIPGAGVAISSFFSYAFEKRISKNPEKFGTGIVEGIAAPESANNAAAQTGFIPMLSFGIPTTPLMALMVGALVMQGIQPGPQVISTNPELFWGLIASMWIGNCILLILNLPMIGIWVKVLQVPRIILFPVIVSACLYGAYSLNNNMFDVWMLIPFTFLGYLLKWLDINPTPMALGFIVGPLLEETFRRSLIISQGNWDTFVQSPISISILSITAVSILVKLYTASASSKYKK